MSTATEDLTTADGAVEGPKGRRGRVLLGAGVAVALAAGGLIAAWPASSAPPAATVHATESEYGIALDATSVPHGHVEFVVHNTGQMTHELVAFKSDLGEGDFPMTGNRVNEDGAGITHLDPEAENVAPGHSKTITLDLQPGRYVIICNLPAHYGMGMHQVITVR